MASSIRRSRLFLVVALSSFLVVGPAVGQTCEDRDLDGYYATSDCGTPRDCNDDDPFRFPGAPEVCDGQDSDCNGMVDDNAACDRTCDAPQRVSGTWQLTDSDTYLTEDLDLVWVGDGWVASYLRVWDNACAWVELRKLDVLGNVVGNPVTVSGGLNVQIWPMNPRLAWSGQQLAVGWQEAPSVVENCGGAANGAWDSFVQRYDRSLQPVGSRTKLGCTGGFTDEWFMDIAWNGHVFGAVWWNTISGMQFTSITRDGVVGGCGVSLSDDYFQDQGTLAAGPDEFGFAFVASPTQTDFSEIYFRRIGETGLLPDPDPVRETFEVRRSEAPSVVWAGSEWGLSWADERDNPSLQTDEVYFMRLTPDGTKIVPPGDQRVTCCQDATNGPHRPLSSLAWTGEEYALGYVQYAKISGYTNGDVLFQRVAATGANLGPPVPLTPDTSLKAREVAVAWTGKQLGVVYTDFPTGFVHQQPFLSRIGCNCTDLDGDHFSTCAGNDCDDGNALVNPSRPELCLDGQDNNCDGKSDCQDVSVCPQGGGSLPGEVQGLAVAANKTTLTWSPDPGSQRYDLMTGDLGFLHEDGSFARARCLAWRVTGTSFSDTQVPVQRRGVFYLVRGKADTCRLGTWGTATRDLAKLTCP